MILFFDTETTGKANFNLPLDHPSQPRLVQLGAILCESDGTEVAQLNVMIRPIGFEIPDEASAIHGITTIRADRSGVGLPEALLVFEDLCRCADEIVCHNVDFDTFIMSVEYAKVWTERLSRPWSGKVLTCTMRQMTSVCRIPGNYGDYKWPKLTEAYRHCFNTDFDGAHGAMADARACKLIYFWLKAKREADKQPNKA